jgi:hypothetical protein
MRTRKILLGLVATAAIATPLALAAAPANAAAPTPRQYANCTEMHKVYTHGVARTLAASRHDGHGAPVRPVVYSMNSGSDRDRDGVACEA